MSLRVFFCIVSGGETMNQKETDVNSTKGTFE